uniref:RRM domain-containing protein n=1 Tax=Diacronema lutheri TaxID=2081491 RepID=A0A7R9UX02_DIALT|mmetsp:Transcript_5081/g.15861  ORF Transcript_5081/g.15861 Transcript_5081/m.15861 type:complete len:369 (+) Transcript_5081:101-1207(+)
MSGEAGPSAPKEEKKEKKDKDAEPPAKKAKVELEEKKAKKASKKDEKRAEPEPAADDGEDELKIHGGGAKTAAAAPNAGGSTTVFIANLSFQIDDAAVKAAFKECGEITSIKWLNDKESGRFKGCGFLEFESAAAAAAALAKNGVDLMERPMKVTPAETKPAREPKAGAGGGGFGDRPHEVGEPNLEVYVGNLSYSIDDDSIKAALKSCGTITNIRWITDRDSGEFKGAGFISFSSLEESAKAIAMHGQDVLGRPLKCSYAKGRPDKAGGGGGAGGGKKFENKLSEKPEGCTKIFCGNLPYDIDDDKMKSFFADCGEVTAIRWLTDKTTGDFKGVGFIDFGSEAAVDLAVKKAGQPLSGRPIRIDFAN